MNANESNCDMQANSKELDAQATCVTSVVLSAEMAHATEIATDATTLSGDMILIGSAVLTNRRYETTMASRPPSAFVASDRDTRAATDSPTATRDGAVPKPSRSPPHHKSYHTIKLLLV